MESRSSLCLPLACTYPTEITYRFLDCLLNCLLNSIQLEFLPDLIKYHYIMNKQIITEVNEGTNLLVFLRHNIALLTSKSVVFSNAFPMCFP